MRTFEVLLDGVLSGALSLETCEGVPAWPPKGGKAGRLAVLMHRAAPGACALSGVVNGNPVLDVVTLPRLAEVCLSERREWFDDLGPFGLLSSEIALMQALWSELDGEAPSLILIAGAEGAALLRDIRRELRRGVH